PDRVDAEPFSIGDPRQGLGGGVSRDDSNLHHRITLARGGTEGAQQPFAQTYFADRAPGFLADLKGLVEMQIAHRG
ncbi:MAG: hypothetical protein AAF485_20780, partial [Chloroflexota bacterium]